MAKRFYIDIDLRNNQLLKATLENTTTAAITEGNPGRVFWATDLDKPCYYDGTAIFEFFYKGEPLDPATIIQTGLDATAQEFLVTEVEKDTWNQLASDSTGFELQANKDQVDGYAGLMDSTDVRPGKLNLSSLWNGMVIEVPDGTATVYKTMGELFDQPYGIAQLDSTGELDPLILKQDGFDSTEQALLVSQDEKDLWATIMDATGYEEQINKGQPDGYAGLDSTAYLYQENQTEGVVIRATKIQELFIDGTGNVGNELRYTFLGESTRTFYFDSTTDTVGSLLDEMAVSLNTTLPESGIVSAVSDGVDTLTVTALASGDDFVLAFSQSGSGWTLYNTITQPAFYNLSNIGGVPTIGFAPLNAAGKVPEEYISSSRDIRVVDTYDDTGTTLIGIPLIERFNGLRVHVIDAQDDPANTDSSGWAEYLWVDQPPVAAFWQRTAERESAIDIDHNSTWNIQGGNPSINQHYHLDQAQYDNLADAEYIVKVANHDVAAEVNNQLQLLTFDSTTFRAARVTISIEDNGPGYQGTVLTELTLMYDGNYAFILDYGEVGTVLSNSVTFIPDQDINSISLYVQSDSTNMSFFARVREFQMFDAIDPPLTPQVDLIPAEGLLPDYVAITGFGVVPTGSLPPGAPLVPGSP